jgi:hypothetical protein
MNIYKYMDGCIITYIYVCIYIYPGKAGSNGYCALISYNPRKQQAFILQNITYTGKINRIEIPKADPVGGVISSITFKCWGAGGGSGGVAAYGQSQGGNYFLYIYIFLFI